MCSLDLRENLPKSVPLKPQGKLADVSADTAEGPRAQALRWEPRSPRRHRAPTSWDPGQVTPHQGYPHPEGGTTEPFQNMERKAERWGLSQGQPRVGRGVPLGVDGRFPSPS